MEATLEDDIRDWMLHYNITHVALKGLIPIFKKHCKVDIRSDPRTIMRTPNSINIVKFDAKEVDESAALMSTPRTQVNEPSYWHNGLDTVLRAAFKFIRHDKSISIDLNIDGLPLHKASQTSFWPILCSIHEHPEMPVMLIGAFCGDSKPKDVQAFLRLMVDDLNHVTANGLQINCKKLTVAVRCFVCDSPARAMIKGTVNFNGANGCQKCTTVGHYSFEARTMIFPEVGKPLRTDEDFRSGAYAGAYCIFDTPLTELSINMIDDFIVADALHLLELGVMKRLLKG